MQLTDDYDTFNLCHVDVLELVRETSWNESPIGLVRMVNNVRKTRPLATPVVRLAGSGATSPAATRLAAASLWRQIPGGPR